MRARVYDVVMYESALTPTEGFKLNSLDSARAPSRLFFVGMQRKVLACLYKNIQKFRYNNALHYTMKFADQ